MSGDLKKRLEEKLTSILQLSEQQEGELPVQEITLLEDTLKQIFKLKRKNLLEAKQYTTKELSNANENAAVIISYLRQLKKDLFTYCMNVVDLLDTKLIPKTKSAEGKLFCLKIKGDFYRYSLECLRKGDQTYQKNLEAGYEAYQTGFNLGTNELSCENQMFLNLCLNFSVFYYTAGEDTGKACGLLSDILSKLDERKETVLPEIWKSIQPTMCLLRNNLVLWLSESEDDHHSN